MVVVVESGILFEHRAWEIMTVKIFKILNHLYFPGQ